MDTDPPDADPPWQISPGCRCPWMQMPLDADAPGGRPLPMQIPWSCEPPCEQTDTQV